MRPSPSVQHKKLVIAQHKKLVIARSYIRTLMIFCDWCYRSFYEGETITIKNLNGTEVPYHGGCLTAWKKNQREVCGMFGMKFPKLQIEHRTYHDGQVNW